jgi:polyisoprenoid-binding protein YceI
MRFILIACALLLSPLSFLFAQTKAKNPAYEVDSLSSNLTWTGHAAVGNYAQTGTLRLGKSSVSYNGQEVTGGRFVIDMTTLATDNPDLQNHLRDADFFDVQKYLTV